MKINNWMKAGKQWSLVDDGLLTDSSSLVNDKVL